MARSGSFCPPRSPAGARISRLGREETRGNKNEWGGGGEGVEGPGQRRGRNSALAQFHALTHHPRVSLLGKFLSLPISQLLEH